MKTIRINFPLMRNWDNLQVGESYAIDFTDGVTPRIESAKFLGKGEKGVPVFEISTEAYVKAAGRGLGFSGGKVRS